ncbi:sulfatase family protein [Rubritalea sp.]|uniref:sulfatase family protein n=1 Tax=Rubritalea sp. TaxID=2109375 RepID=UPI003EF8251D
MKTIVKIILAAGLCSHIFAAEKPNVVVIFTDDQGYADLGCFGGKQLLTPNIDQMAKEGARLTSFYVAAPVCTPSRAALMTGCYPQRVDMAPASSLEVKLSHIPAGTRFPVCLAGDGQGLNPDEFTIAEAAQSAGYKTGMFGKWHLGDQPEFLPTRQGFEEFFGIPYSHDITPKHKNNKAFNFPPLPVLEGEEVIELSPDPRYLTRRITERAVGFIKEHKDENFFMYVAHPLPHGPVVASPEISKQYAEELKKPENKKKSSKIYPTAIHEIDWSVGEILNALKEQGIDENTIVLFTSDNGPASGSARPLSGKKTKTLEGGMRVPTVIRWPKGIKAGSDNDTLMTAMDVLPTFAKLMGAKLPEDKTIDGKDMMPVLVDGAESQHEYFFYNYWGTTEAVRWKSWKLREVDGKVALYNLAEDISEKKNLAAQHPEIVQRLKEAVSQFDTEMAKEVRPAGRVENPKELTLKN